MNRLCRLIWSTLAAAWAAVFGTGALAQATPPTPTALPTGGQVVAGQAALQQQGSTLTVNQQSGRAAIDWQSFDVGSQARVDFVQPSANAVVLNRVQGGQASQIFGRITANGQVFLSNPNGVYFAPGASVDVGGLVATTHRIGLDDFVSGKLRFERNGATGSVVNEAELRASLGGYIALLAPEVRNQGVILANLGTVALAAGEAYELRIDAGRTLAALRVEPATMRALVDNRSAVLAPGGLVILSAQAVDRVQGGVVRNSGRIEATGIAQRGGRIVLEASDRIDNSGSIAANAGADGPAGSVSLTAPVVVASGSIEAMGAAQHESGSQGGRIGIDAVTLLQAGTGRFDASGPAQGGSVSVQASGSVVLAGRSDVSGTGEGSRGGSVTVHAAQIDLDAATVAASGELQGGQVRLHADAALALAMDGSAGVGMGVGAGVPTASASAPAAPAPSSPAPRPGQLALIGNTVIDSRGRRGQGGSVTLLGTDIALRDTATLDARGASGGGQVLVGGQWQGGGDLPQATTVTMDAGARIDVSATDLGDGGTAVLWSDIRRADSATFVDGTILAQAGAAGGRGGQVETSGHDLGIGAAATVRTGAGGLWLLDPADITISSAANNGHTGFTPNSGAAAATVNVATLVAALNSGDVAVTTQNSGSAGAGNGDITVNAAIAKTGGTDSTLTLKAARDIRFNGGANVSSSNSKLNLVLVSDFDSSGGGGVYFDGSGTPITVGTQGGHVWIGGNAYGTANGSTAWNGLQVGTGVANSGATTVGFEAVSIIGTAIATGGGDVSIAGRSGRYNDNETRYGVRIRNGSSISTGAGSIAIDGTLAYVGGNPTNKPAFHGVDIDTSSLQASTGSITLSGSDVGATMVSGGGAAVRLYNTSVATTGTTGGHIAITGSTGAEAGSGVARQGVLLQAYNDNTSTAVSTVGGNITITGTNNLTNSADSNGISWQTGKSNNNDANHVSIKVVSRTGNVTLTGDAPANSNTGSAGIVLNATNWGKFFIGWDGSNAYSGTTTLTGRSVVQTNVAPGYLKVGGSGALVIQPTGNSFVRGNAAAATLDFVSNWDFGSGHSAITFGKAGAIARADTVTVSNPISLPGTLSVYAGTINLNSTVTKTGTADATATLQANGNVSLNSGSGFTAGSGKLNVVLWSRATGAAEGWIHIDNSTIATNGGHLWMGGGTQASTAWNGLTVGSGAAATVAQTTVALGIWGGTAITTGGGNVWGSAFSNYGATTATWASAVLMDNARITSGGGGISLTGVTQGAYNSGSGVELRNGSALTSTSGSISLSGSTSASVNPTGHVFGTYLTNKVTVSSDSGAINLYGTNNANSAYGGGIWFGSNAASNSVGDGNQTSGVGNGYNVALVSNSGAILLDARAASSLTTGWSHAAIVLAYDSDRQLIKTGSGNITIKGDANVARDDASGVQFQVNTATGNVHVVSTSGDIYVQGYQHSGSTATANNALRVTPGNAVGSVRFGAASDGAGYSGKLTFEADSIWTNTANTSLTGAIKAYGSGGFAIQATGTTSVKDLILPTQWDLGSSHSSFAVGKATETKWMRLDGSITAAGPITVVGGEVEIWGNLTSTASGAGISLLARNNVWSVNNANTITTNAGAVVLASDTDNSNAGFIRSALGVTIDTRVGLPGSKSTSGTGGGAITLGGGNMQGTGYAAGVDATRAEGIRIDNGFTALSGGGDINLRGKSWAGSVASGTGAWGVGFWNGATSLNVDAGSGRVRFEGISRSSGNDSLKIGIATNAAVLIQSAYAGADAITLIGTSTASSGTSWKNGIDLGGTTSNQAAATYQRLIASGAGGGITLQGAGTDVALLFRNGSQVLANGGAIRLLGVGSGSYLAVQNGNTVWWGSAAGSAVTTSTSNLLIEFDLYGFSGTYPNIATNGSTTIRSSSAAFGQSMSSFWFNWNQNGQTTSGLTVGRATNTQPVLLNGSNNNAGTTLTVAGPVTAYGSTVTLTSPLVVTGTGDIYLEALAGSVAINNTIAKTGGADATLTLKATNAVNVTNNISAGGGGTGKLNMVFWADSDASRAGGDTFNTSTYTTNGGHVWIGGSATPGGSTTWNGLTVGNGASSGAYGGNYNGIDLTGTFNTGNGDFYAAGKTYVATASNWDIMATLGSVAVNAGSGNVTFAGNKIDFGGVYVAGATTTVTTTGVLTIRPFEDSFTTGFNVKGGVSGSDWLGTTVATVSNSNSADTRANAAVGNNLVGTANLVIRNVASLGGLVIGKAANTNTVTVYNSLSIAGDISVYGGQIANQNGAGFTSSAGNILLDADLDRTLNFNGAGISWNGALTASSTAAGKGKLTLLGRGGTRAGSNQGVVVGASSVFSAGGDVAITGVAPTNGNAGVQIDAGASIAAGRTLSVDGRNTAAVSGSSNDGLRVLNNVQLTSAGALSLTGQAGIGSSGALTLMQGAALTTTGTTGSAGITLTALNGSIASASGGNATAATVMAGAGSGITLTADLLAIDASMPLALNTTGVLTLQPANASWSSPLTWNGSLASGNFAGSGSLANVRINSLANIGGLVLGKAGNTSNITIAAGARAAGTVELHGRDLALNAALTASGNATAANNRIVLDASGTVTQSAALAANGLALLGGGNFQLTHSGNDVAVLAAGSARRIAYLDSNGISVGMVGATTGVSASGPVQIETQSGDLNLLASVATTATTTDAVVLNAGKAKAVADGDFLSGAGGNVTIGNGATVTTGAGGRATLYSGTVSGSTGLTALVGSGSGRFRYGSDEVTANYLSPLTTGLYAVYRQQPTISLRGADQSVVYGTEPALAVTASGMANGDTVASSMGRLPGVTLMDGASAATRNANGNFNVRRSGGSVAGYGMALSRNAVSSLGYALAYDDSATTTVTPKALTAVINDDAKFAGLADTAGYAGATFSGFVRGESAANISPSVLITRSIAGEAVGTYANALTASASVAAGNYTLAPSDVTAGSYSIVGADTLIVRVDSASAVYGSAAAYNVAQVRYFNSASNAEVSLTQGSSAFNWNVGGNTAQAVDFTLASAGVNVGTYGITGTVTTPHTLPGTGSGNTPSQLLAIGGRLTVTPRTLTVAATKVYDGSDTLSSGNVTLGNLAAGETLTVSAAKLSDRNVATANKYVSNLTLANGTGLASNYQLPSLAAYAAGSNSATVTQRALGVAVDKVYDGLASATAAQTTLTNLAAGEALLVQGVTLSTAHVATAGKYVSALTLADSGPFRLSNYSLPSLFAAGAGNAVTITAAPLTVGVASATNTGKTYDGTTATAAGFTATLAVSGYVAGDNGSVTSTAAYDSRNVDAARIALSNLALASVSSTVGSVASDYALDGSAAFTAGSITPRTVAAATAAAPSKVYDGTTGVDGAVVAIAAATSTTGKITGDDLRIVAVGGAFSAADAGTARTYTLADITLAGADARNYALASGSISGSDGTITPRPLTLTASKVYDGSTALPAVTLGNLAAGQYLAVSGAAASSSHVGGPDGNVATADNYVSALTLTNVLDGGTPVYKTANYSLPGSGSGVTSGAVNSLSANASNSAAITAAPLTVTTAETAVSKVYDGSAAAAAGYTAGYAVSGLVGGDTAATLTQTGKAFDSATVAGASSFTLSGIGIASVSGSNGSVGSDYALNTTTLTLPGSITARPVAVDVAAGIRKTYDATTGFNNLAIGLTSVAGDANSGLIVADTANVVVGASGGGFDSKDAGSGKSYTLTGLGLSGSAAANYRIVSGDSISGLNGVVDPKQLAVSGLDAVTRTYDGSTTAASYTGAAGSLLTVAPGGATANDGRTYIGDSVLLAGSATSGVYNSKDVSTASLVTWTGYSLAGADAANYTLLARSAGSITLKALAATTTLAAKTYDATTALTVTGTTLANLVGSETLNVTTTGVLDSADAGGRTGTLTYLLADGSNGGLASNYSLAAATRAVTVAQKTLTMTGTTVANKVYDGSTAAAVTLGTLSGLVGSQTLVVSAAGVFDSANAGSRTATVSHVLANGSNGGLAANYSLAPQSGIAATITPKTVTLAAGKVYDGTAALGAGQITLGGLIGGQTLGYAGATASNAHVASAGKFISAITLADGTGLAANYQLPVLNAANAPVTVTAKALTASAAITGATTRAYDGTTATSATVNTSVSGAVSGDTVSLVTGGITLAYDSAHVANATQIAASGGLGLSVSGSNGSVASDYSVTLPSIAAVSASITPATLTATLANSGVTKAYDGGTAAPSGFAPSWSYTGLVSGDTAAVLTNIGAAYDSKDVAAASKVTVGGLALAGIVGNRGSQLSDYGFAQTSADVAAAVTQKTVTLAAGKVYDGSTSLAAMVTLGGLIGSEALGYAGATTSDAHVATSGKFISAITLLSGTGLAGNYQLPTLNATNAPVTITARPLTATLLNSGVTKVYDGGTSTPGGFVPSWSVGGLVSGDSAATITHAGTAYDSKDVAAATKVTVSGLALSGITGSHGSQTTDYSLAQTSADAAAAITPKTVTLAASKTYDGTTALAGHVTLGGLVGGEALAYAGATASDAHVATAGKSIGAITLVDGTGLAGNYQLPALNATNAPVAIAAKPLTMAAAITGAASKVYDGTTSAHGAGLTVNVSGAVAGDTLSLDTGGIALAYDSAHVAGATQIAATGSLGLAVSGSHGSVASDYAFTLPGIAAVPAAIAPATLTATLTNNGLTKVYDGGTAAPAGFVPGWSTSGLVNGDTAVNLTSSGSAYDSKDVAAASKVTVSGIALAGITGSHGSQASDYTLAHTSADAAATITPKTVTLAAAKTYDGTTALVAGQVTIGGLIGSETLAHAGATASDAHVATTAKFIDAITLVDGTGLAGNYQLPALNATNAAVTISARALTATAAIGGAASKVYDGSTAAGGASITGSVTGAVGGDSIALDVSGITLAYDAADVAAATQIAAHGSLGLLIAGSHGSLASDYSVTLPTLAALPAGITPKALTLAAGKTYDGTTALAGHVALGGLIGSEALGYTGATASDAHVATAGKHIGAITLLDGTGLASNYQLPPLDAAHAPVTITPRPLATGAAIVGTTTRAYDGSTATTATVHGSVTGAAGGDTVSLFTGGITLAYDSAHVATATQIAASGSLGLVIAGSHGSVASDYAYTLPSIAAVPAGITPATLAATLANGSVTKVYDGSTSAPAGFAPIWVYTGLVGGDTAASLTHTGAAYDSQDVAGASKVTVGGLALAGITGSHGSQPGDYSLAQTSADAAAAITPKTLTLAAGKPYDGSTALAGHVTIGGLVGGEALGYAGAAASDAHVATTGKFISAISLADGTGLASNYRLPPLDAANAPVTISARPLTTSAAIVGATTKVYDGTSAATGASLAAGVSGAVAGDTVTLDTRGITLAYDSTHAASATAIVANGNLVLTIAGSHGSAASDYAVTLPTVAAVPAGITPAALTATLANSGITKVYDGSTSAPAGFAPVWSYTGLVGGDTGATLTSTGSAYDSKDAAGAGRLTASGLALAGITGSRGSQRSDYAFTQTSADAAATIVPKVVTVTGLAVADKTYDGTAVAPVTHWGSVATGVGSETLTLSAGGATFADADAGSGKTVTASGYRIADGSGSAGNYRLASTSATATADIAKAVLTVVANNDAKFVTQPDNLLGSGYSGVSIGGFVAGETAAVLGGAASVVRGNAGSDSAGVYRGVLTADVSGLSAANYSFATRPGDYTIVPANQLLVRTANADTVYGSAAAYTVTSASYFDGSSVRQLAVTPTGQNGWTVSDGAGGSASFSLLPMNTAVSSAGVARVGVYQLGATAVTTTNAQNFSDTLTVVGAHTVTPKALTPNVDNGVTKVYDGSTAMTGVQIALPGLLAGDQVGASGQGTFASRNAGSGLAYTVGDVRLAGADAANYRLAGGASFSGSNGSITPRALTVGVAGVDKVYDGQTTAAFTTTDDRIAGDSFAVHGSASFADKNVGAGKAVAVTGIGLTGADAANYTVAPTAATSAGIARLGSVRWVGGASGNWFDPANWAGGAVPDLANVANVLVPAGVQVRFDTAGAVAPAVASAPVRIDSLVGDSPGSSGSLLQRDGTLAVGAGGIALQGLTQQGGSLASAGNLQLERYAQSGGSTSVRGRLAVNGSFSQGSAGTLAVDGDARINATQGGATLGNLQLRGRLDIASAGGDVTQAAGTAVAVGGATAIDAGGNRIVLDAAGNDFGGRFDARAAAVTVVDGSGGLELGDVTAASLQATSSGGSLTQAAGSRIAVSGSATLAAPGHEIAIARSGNKFGRLATPGSTFASTLAGAGSVPPDPDAPAIALPQRDSAPPAPDEIASTRSDGLHIDVSLLDSDEITVTASKLATLAGFGFELPPALTAGLAPDAVVAARRESGRALPDWLVFDAERRRFVASAVPPRRLPLRLTVTLGDRSVTVVLQAERLRAVAAAKSKGKAVARAG